MPKDIADFLEGIRIALDDLSLKDSDTIGTKRPDKDADRLAWNDYLEHKIAAQYSEFNRPNYTSVMMEDLREFLGIAHAYGLPRLYQENARRTEEIIDNEGRLIHLAVKHETFEAEWKSTESEKRREIVLEGLYRGSCYCPCDDIRISCPEMTIDGLIGDGDFNLINLLKRIVAHDPVGNFCVKEIYLFSHPYIEYQYRHTDNAPEILKAKLYQSILLRNAYIVATLYGIVEAFYGIPFKPPTPTLTFEEPSQERKQDKRLLNQAIRFAFGDLGKGAVEAFQCITGKDENPLIQYACYKCHAKREDKKMLKRCSRCQLVWYCSAECQSKDWKDHKKYCGQKKFDPKLLTPTKEGPDVFIGCPDPVPGFTRSPALLRQIWYLSKPDSQGRDYHINLEFDRSRSLMILHPYVRLVFFVARSRAMASGSKAAVYQMFKILEHQEHVGYHGLSIDQIRTQLEGEYMVTITPATMQSEPEKWVPPTFEELKVEKEYLMQRLARTLSDEELKKLGVKFIQVCK